MYGKLRNILKVWKLRNKGIFQKEGILKTGEFCQNYSFSKLFKC